MQLHFKQEMLSRPEILEEYIVGMSNMTIVGRNLSYINEAGVKFVPQGALTFADRHQVIFIVNFTFSDQHYNKINILLIL